MLDDFVTSVRENRLASTISRYALDNTKTLSVALVSREVRYSYYLREAADST